MHRTYTRSVGKDADFAESNTVAGLERSGQTTRIDRLDTDDLYFRSQILDVRRHARNQTATADRNENGVNVARMLVENLHATSALTGNDVVMVIRRNKLHIFTHKEGKKTMRNARGANQLTKRPDSSNIVIQRSRASSKLIVENDYYSVFF